MPQPVDWNMRAIAAARINRLRARLQRFDGAGDLWVFLCIGVALTLAPLALSSQRLPRLLARLDRVGPVQRLKHEGAPGLTRAQADKLAVYADFWLRRLRPENPCLRRSLVLFGWLRRAGLPVTFCLGIRTDQTLHGKDPLQGHAWLELEGRVILEPATAVVQHVRTYHFPPHVT